METRAVERSWRVSRLSAEGRRDRLEDEGFSRRHGSETPIPGGKAHRPSPSDVILDRAFPISARPP